LKRSGRQPREEVSASRFRGTARGYCHNVDCPVRDVTFLGRDRARVIDHVINVTRPGDLVITLGAGDVNQLGAELLLRLEAGAPGGRITC